MRNSWKENGGESGGREPFLSRHRWILFPITFFFFAGFALFSVDLHHDGVVLVPAMDVASGGAVFRDTFSQYGILTPLLQGLAVKLFGAELLVLRLLTVAVYGGCAVLLDRLYCRFLSVPFRWGLFALFLALAPFYLWEMHAWPSVYALCCMLLGAELMVCALESGSNRALFCSGVAAAAAFGFRQPCGMVMLAAGFLALALEAWCRRLSPPEWLRRYGCFLGGCAALLALFAAYLTMYGAWADYIRQTWIFPASFAGERGEGGSLAILFGCLFPLRSVFLLFPLASLGLLGWVGLRLFRRRDDREALLLAAVLIAGLASWHQYFPVPCIRHLYWSGIPMFGAFLLVLQLLWRSPWRKAVRIPLFALLLAWPVWAAGERVAGVMERIASIPQRRCSTLPGVRGILMEGEFEAAYFSAIEQALRRVPPEYAGRMFLNVTPHALFCRFFADRPGLRPMYVNWNNSVYPDYAENATEAVREFRPLIMSIAPEPFRGYRPVGGFPESEPYYYLSVPPE